MMLEITVFLLSWFIDFLPDGVAENPFCYKVADGTTLEQLFLGFGLPLEQVTNVYVNNQAVQDYQRLLCQGDTVVALPFTIGG